MWKPLVGGKVARRDRKLFREAATQRHDVYDPHGKVDSQVCVPQHHIMVARWKKLDKVANTADKGFDLNAAAEPFSPATISYFRRQ